MDSVMTGKTAISLFLFSSLLLSGCESGSSAVDTGVSEPAELGSMTVYVSPSGSDAQGTGAEDRPWASIQFAVDSVTPGSIIYVKPGIYQELITISGAADSGVVNNPVVIKGGPGVIVDAGTINPVADKGILTIENASYIYVAGIEFRNLKTEAAFSTDTTPAGIVIRGTGTDITISGNKIHGIEENATCTQNDNNCDSAGNGIGVYGTTPGGLKNIRITGNEIYNNILGASESLTINGNVDGFIVDNNYVHDNNNIGIDAIGYEGDVCPTCTTTQNRARNGIFRDNRAENNSIAHFTPNPWYAGEDGNAAGIYIDGGHHILIEGNVTTGNDLGVEVASEAPGGDANDIIVASNLFYNNFDIGIALGGYDANSNLPGGGSIHRVKIINNTFYHNAGHSSEITVNYRIHDMRFINNIIFDDTAINDSYEQAAGNIQSSGLVWDNNLWWSSGTIDDVPVADAGAVVANPDFVNIAGGSSVVNAGSPAIDAGQAETALPVWPGTFWAQQFPAGTIPVHGTADVDGTSGIVGSVDIGAAEQ